MNQQAILLPAPKSDFRHWVEQRSGQDVSKCYQCGKCTAGCPTSFAMDLGPRRVMRALQLGLKEEALASTSIWLCVSCQTCSARCPREIDIAKVMESVALLSLQEKRKPAVKEVGRFHNLFLSLIGRFGRIYDLGLAGINAILSGSLFSDASLAWRMFSKNRFPLLPPSFKGASQAGDIERRVRELESIVGNLSQGGQG